MKQRVVPFIHEIVALVTTTLFLRRRHRMKPQRLLRLGRGHKTVNRLVLNGWSLFWAISGVLLLMSLIFLTAVGFNTEGYRLVIRATARTSLALFLVAFLASAVLARWPGSFAEWLVQNRRAFGLGFAMSHAIHLAAIITFARTDWATFWTLSSKGAIIAGSIAYVVIGLLAATSFNAAVRWLGPARWQRVHRAGLWFVWLFFMFTNGKRILGSTWYVLPVVMLLIAMAVRLRTARPQPAIFNRVAAPGQ
jgi:DMSO/TMAO reductase YedYZ heme-binding membrane subunit